MAMLDWLFRKKANKPIQREQDVPLAKKSQPTDRESFCSPTLLAQWVNRWCLEGLPLEENYSYLPSEEQLEAFSITYEQRERYVREIAVLRLSGVSLFIKTQYGDEFWRSYSCAVYPYLAHYLYPGQDSSSKLREVADAVEAYVAASSTTDEKKMASLYMHRVYDDSDHYLRLAIGGVGFLSVKWLMDAYTIFRDTYCQVTQGMPYESVKLISEAMETIQREGEPQELPKPEASGGAQL